MAKGHAESRGAAARPLRSLSEAIPESQKKDIEDVDIDVDVDIGLFLQVGPFLLRKRLCVRV